MKKKYIFVIRGFYWDWWEKISTGEMLRFKQGQDPNEYLV